MSKLEKYLNEQGKNMSMEDILYLAFEDGFDEGFELAMHYSDDPGDLAGSVPDREYAKKLDSAFQEFIKKHKSKLK